MNRYEWVYKTFFKDQRLILDAGCRTGAFCNLAPQKIIGVEYDPDYIKVCKKKGFNVKFANLEERLPFKDNFFDGVNCLEVLEHLFNPQKTVKEFYRILKPNGRLVISVPCYKYFRAFYYQHHTFFNEQDPRIMVENDGFIVEKTFEIRGLRIIEMLGNWFGIPIAKLLPKLGFHGMIYLVARKSRKRENLLPKYRNE